MGVFKRALVAVAVLTAVVAFAILNYLEPVQGGNNLFVILGKLAHLALFGVFWWAVYGTGRLAGRLVLGRLATPPEIDLALGVVVTVVISFALCALGIAYEWLFKGLIIVAAAAGAWLLRADVGRAPARVRRWFAVASPGAIILAAVVGAVLFPVTWTAATPPVFWDALTYHLAVPNAYVQAHGFTYLPYNVYASMPLGGSLFYLAPIQWDGLITASASHLVVSLLALALTYRLARLWLERFYAAFAAALVALTPAFANCMAVPQADHFQILFAVAALYVYFCQEGDRPGAYRRGILATGVFLGAAMGVKYVAAAVGALVIYGAAAAMVAPWLVKAWVERGNPVFPLLYDVFGGRDFTAEQARRLLAWHTYGIGAGRAWGDWLLLPYRVAVKSDLSYGHFMGIVLPYLLPLAALAVLAFRRGGRVVAFGWAHFFAWALGSQQLRFLGSALPALAVAAAGAAAAGEFGPNVWVKRVWRWGIAALALVAALPFFTGIITQASAASYYILGASRDEYLAATWDEYDAQAFVNRRLPADARLLMVFTNHTLYLRRDAVYDSFTEASPFLLAAEKAGDASALDALARRWGITHVALYRRYESDEWARYDPRAARLFYQFLDRYTYPVYRDGCNDIYELLPEGTSVL
jgi:hypothetical protein